MTPRSYPTEFVAGLVARGVRLASCDHGQLVVDAPKGALGPEDVEGLRRSKAEVLELVGLAVDRPDPERRRLALESLGNDPENPVGCGDAYEPPERITPTLRPLLGTVSLADVRRSLAELRHQTRAQPPVGSDGHRPKTPKSPTGGGLDGKHLLGTLKQEGPQ